jgi:alpha-L-fucosidase
LYGNINGKAWIPAECDVSIRPGWFYRQSEDGKVKTPSDLFQLYLKSVGRGANLLLNVPPDQRGLIHAADSASIVGFNRLRVTAFENDLARKAHAKFNAAGVVVDAPELNDGFQSSSHWIEPGTEQLFRMEFDSLTSINTISLMEDIRFGQAVKQFEIIFWNGNKATGSIFGTTIGRKRILTFPEKQVTAFSLFIHQAKLEARISGISAFRIDPGLLETKDRPVP